MKCSSFKNGTTSVYPGRGKQRRSVSREIESRVRRLKTQHELLTLLDLDQNLDRAQNSKPEASPGTEMAKTAVWRLPTSVRKQII